MEGVFTAQERSFDEIRHVGVAIAAINAEQRHIGLLHRDAESNDVLMLHLAFHRDLRNEPAKAKYLWIDPPILAERLIHVAAWCRLIWNSNQDDFPYAFSEPGECFDAETGKFLIGPTKYGLTCATFVLALFDVAGLKLVNYATWPTGRPGDREWQEYVVAQLPPTEVAHIEAVRSEVGSVRFRPEEVAGAATVSPLPVDFATAVERGEKILKRLEAVSKP